MIFSFPLALQTNRACWNRSKLWISIQQGVPYWCHTSMLECLPPELVFHKYSHPSIYLVIFNKGDLRKRYTEANKTIDCLCPLWWSKDSRPKTRFPDKVSFIFCEVFTTASLEAKNTIELMWEQLVPTAQKRIRKTSGESASSWGRVGTYRRSH